MVWFGRRTTKGGVWQTKGGEESPEWKALQLCGKKSEMRRGEVLSDGLSLRGRGEGRHGGFPQGFSRH